MGKFHCALWCVLLGMALASPAGGEEKKTSGSTTVPTSIRVQPERLAKAQKVLEERLYVAMPRPALEGTLGVVLRSIGASAQIPVRLDMKALSDAGISEDDMISLRASNVTCAALFDGIVHDHDLAWVIEDDQIVITTTDKASAKLEYIVYPVADLVITRDRSGEATASYTQLIDMITTTVAP